MQTTSTLIEICFKKLGLKNIKILWLEEAKSLQVCLKRFCESCPVRIIHLKKRCADYMYVSIYRNLLGDAN
jgi:hypothetical protein